MKLLLLGLLLALNLSADEYASLLFHGNCTTCHEETKTISAPSIIAIKENYINAFSDKKSFVDYMSTWVHSPNEEGSLMHDAIDKHGLMPSLAFDKESLKTIAAYIYDTNFSQEHRGHKE